MNFVIVILFINNKQASLVLVCKHYWRVDNNKNHVEITCIVYGFIINSRVQIQLICLGRT